MARKTRTSRSGGKKPGSGGAAVAGKKKGARLPVTAETLAGRQREISVSEFFAKNRHLLGFDNPRRALLTTVKEAVDNALDACEEAGILPEIHVRIEHLPEIDESRYRITIEDNGPGIVRKQIDNIFGKLLYGSKFHRLKMSRGQQGIGISAAGMYGLMTTGKPMVIVTRSSRRRPAHHVELAMDTTKNRPEVSKDVETDDFPDHTGTRVSIELEGKYLRGRTSVEAYLEQTAIANPHAQISFDPPGASAVPEEAALLEEEASDAEAGDEDADADRRKEVLDEIRTRRIGQRVVFPRAVDDLPPEPAEIKPHPRGVELGTLIRMLKQTEHKHVGGFLSNEFSRVSGRVSQQICDAAGLTTSTWVASVGHAEAEALYKAIRDVKIMGPPLDCLAPIGTKTILAGLLKGVRAEFYTASTRPPAVYRGNPFQIEVGLAFGGELKSDEPARVIRFANRVPLLYQQSACALFRACVETSWRNYGLTQARGAAPEAPMVIMIHMASVWVPFTSESKEAIADYDEIRKEMRLALQECGRKLASYVRKRQRIRREGQRRDVFRRYIAEVARALHTIEPDLDPQQIREHLERVAKKRTELADQEVDEHGNPIGRKEPGVSRLERDEDTVILEAPPGDDEDDGAEGGAGAGEPTPSGGPSPKRRRGASNKKRSGGGGKRAGAGRRKGRRRSSGETNLFQG